MRTLRSIKFIDLRASQYETVDVTSRIIERGEVLNKMEKLKRKKGDNAVEIVKLEKELKAKTAALDKAKQEFEKQLKQWQQNGSYKFKKKVIVDYFGERAPAPEHYLKWVRYDQSNNYRESRDMAAAWNYSYVEPGIDPYWPEGVGPTDGKYVYGDLVLMKVPLREYLVQRHEAIQRAKQGKANAVARFEAEVEKSGSRVPREEIAAMQDSYKRANLKEV